MGATQTPYGLKPRRLISGRNAAGGLTTELFRIKANYSGVIPYGAPVRLSLTNDPSSSFGAGYIVNVSGTTMTQSSVQDYYVGVFVGCSYTDPSSGQPRWDQWYPGSVNDTTTGDMQAYVITDPGAVFQIQANTASFDALAAMGTSFNLVIPGTPYNSTTKDSTISLDTSATVSAGPFKIVGISSSPDNTNATGYVDCLVKINGGYHIYERTL